MSEMTRYDQRGLASMQRDLTISKIQRLCKERGENAENETSGRGRDSRSSVVADSHASGIGGSKTGSEVPDVRKGSQAER